MRELIRRHQCGGGFLPLPGLAGLVTAAGCWQAVAAVPMSAPVMA
jgi:hypothetical protein